MTSVKSANTTLIKTVKPTNDCSICCEPYNKSTHKPIICNKCNISVCMSCIKRYVLGTYDVPHCMGCRQIWTFDTLVTKLTRVFIDTELKKHRQKVLFDAQKARLPEDADYAEMVKRAKVTSVTLTDLHTKYSNMSTEYFACLRKMTDSIAQYNFVNTEPNESENLKQMAIQISIIKHNMKIAEAFHSQAQNAIIIANNGGVDVTQKKEFKKKCGVADCNGFLSTRYKCGICETWTCPSCFEIKGPNEHSDHTCDPNNVATATAIKNETRGCPSCSSLIFKIHGCDQMFCTSCHTGFSWNTGKIINGGLHNPHYFDYLRTTGQLNNRLQDNVNIGQDVLLNVGCGIVLNSDLVIQKTRECVAEYLKGLTSEENDALKQTIRESKVIPEPLCTKSILDWIINETFEDDYSETSKLTKTEINNIKTFNDTRPRNTPYIDFRKNNMKKYQKSLHGEILKNILPCVLETPNRNAPDVEPKLLTIDAYSITRLLTHIPEVTMRGLGRQETHKDNRVSFILGDLSVDGFMDRLYKADFMEQRNRDKHMLLTMFVTAGTDIITRLFATPDADYRKLMDEFVELMRYANEQLKIIAKIYKNVPLEIKIDMHN